MGKQRVTATPVEQEPQILSIDQIKQKADELNQKKSSSFLSIDEVKERADQIEKFGTPDRVARIDIDEYDKYLPEGSFINPGLDKARAQNQSTLSQMLNAVPQTIGGIGLGIIENAGYIAELPKAVKGDERDFSNNLVEWAKRNRKRLDEAFPIFRENPNETFDITDGAWWVTHGQGLVESIGEFVGTGAGIGKGLGLLGRAASLNARLAGAISQGATAATLSYVEGAMSGSEIYKEVLKDLSDEVKLGKLTKEQAENRAGDAAAKTVVMNTLLTAPLNITGIAPLFRSNSTLKRLGDLGLKRNAGESALSFRKRATEILRNIDQDKLPPFYKRILAESIQEGIEENINLFSEEEGRIQGGLSEGGGTYVSRFLKNSLTQEGALNFMLGAIGGAGQTGALRYAPINRNNEGQLITNAQLEKEQFLREKESSISFIANTLDNLEKMESLKNRLSEAVDKNEVENIDIIKDQMFNISASYNITKGSAQPLIESFNQIAALDNTRDLTEDIDQQLEELQNQRQDLLAQIPQLQQEGNQEGIQQVEEQIQQLESQANELLEVRPSLVGVTEAMQQGVTNSKFDNDYKTIASNKAGEIQSLQAKYEQIYNKATDPNEISLGLYDEIFNENANAEHYKNVKLLQSQNLSEARLPLFGGLNASAASYLNNRLDDRVIDSLINKYENINTANDTEKILLFNTLDKDAIKSKSEDVLRNLKQRKRDREIEFKGITKDDFVDSNVPLIDLDNNAITLAPLRESELEAELLENSSLKRANDLQRRGVDKDNFIRNQKRKADKNRKEQEKIYDQDKQDIRKSIREAEKQIDKYNTIPLSDEQKSEFEALVKDMYTAEEKLDRTKITAVVGFIAENPTEQEVVNEEDITEIPTDIPVAQDLGDLINNAEEQIEEETNLYTESNKFRSDPSTEFEDLGETKVIEDAGTAIANLVKNYKGKGRFKRTSSNELNPDYPVKLMTGLVNLGDDVVLEIDTNYTLQVEDRVVTFKDIQQKEREEDKKNMLVPIRILHQGEHIGYLHDIDWINEDNVAAGDNNITTQIDILTRLRNKVANEGGRYQTKIKDVGGSSQLSINVQTDEDGSNMRSSSFSFQNPQLEFGVVKANGIFSGIKTVDTDNTPKWMAEHEGFTVAIVPYPNKQGKLAVPLSVNKVNEQDVNDLYEVMKLYINKNLNDQDTNNRNEIFAGTDLDITKWEDAKEYIERFIRNYPLTKEARETISNQKSGKHYFNITEQGITIQESGFNSTVIKKGEDISESMERVLKDHLSKMYYNIDNNRIGQDIETVIFNNEGKASVVSDRDYVEFLKSNTSTNLWENTFEYNGKQYYSYFDNPLYFVDDNFDQPKNRESIEIAPKQTETVEKFGYFKRRGVIPDANSQQEDINYSPIAEDDKLDELRKLLFTEVDADFTPQQLSDIVDTFYSEIIYNVDEDGMTLEEAFNNLSSRIKGNPTELFQKIDKHKKSIFPLVRKKLLVNNVIYSQEDNIDLDGLEDKEFSFEKVQFNDDAVFGIDNKFNTSTDLKKFFSLTADKFINEKGEFVDKLNLLNNLVYLPTDTVFNTLKSVLADTEPVFNTMVQKLEDTKPYIPWLDDVILRFKYPDSYGIKDVERFQNEFVAVMSNSDYNFKTFLYSESKGKTYTNVIDSNRNSKQKRILGEWVNNFRTTELVDIKDNDFVVNTDEVEKVINSYDTKILNNKDFKGTPEVIRSFSKRLGITLSDSTVKYIMSEMNPVQEFKSSGGMFKVMYDRLKGKDNDTSGEEFNKNNPFVNNSGIQKLSRIEAENGNKFVSGSFINSQGNVINTINQKREISRRMVELSNPEKAEQLLNVPFYKNTSKNYNTWLELFAANNADFKNNFKVEVFEAFNKVGRGLNGIKVNQQSDRQLESSRIIGFINNGSNKYSKYIHLVPAKNTTFVFNAPKENVGFTEDVFIDNIKLNRKTLDKLFTVVESEINRINSANEIQDSKDSYVIPGYKPDQFYFFDQLNDFDLILNGRVDLNADLKSKINDALALEFQAVVQNKIQHWKELGLLNEQNQSTGIIPTGRNIVEFASDYVFNNMMFNFNMHQFVVGDPALFAKRGIEATFDNISKRLTKDQAPGVDVAVDPDNPNYIQIALEDSERASLNIDQIKNRIPEDLAKAYENIEGTDAQEYTTGQEHLNVLKQLGKVTSEQYDDILNKLDNGQDLSDTELNLFQPLKPVAAGKRVVESDQGIVVAEVTDYVKSSSIPLIKQLTEGTELDNLRQAMEELQAKENLFVRASYATANKIGGANPVKIFDQEGNVEVNIQPENFVVQSRRGFRLQQEVPFDINKNKVTDGTQQRKLILLEANEDIKQEYEETYKNIYEDNFNSFKDEIFDKGFLDINKVKDLLVEEATSRGWSQNDIKGLELLDGDFKMPLFMNASSNRIEALLNSLINNKVLKQKRTGGSFVLTSEEGYKGFNPNTIYTDQYDGELKPARIEGGKVLPAQILIPNKLRDNNGKLINLRKLTKRDEEGRLIIDSEKLPQELTRGFGFRIPTQGYNSMSHVEVVGFLPSNRDIVVAPRDFVTQMGSDFDVDKLNIFFYDVQFDENNIGSKIENNNNKLLDLDIQIMSDESIYPLMIEPLTSGDLKKLGTRKPFEFTRLYDRYSFNKYSESKDGASGIGVFATLGTFLSVSKGRDLAFTDSEGNPFNAGFADKKGNSISDPNTLDGKLKVQINSYFLNASVDNEKDPILGAINANTITFGAIQAMISSGFEEADIVKFINQPVIVDYVNNLSALVDKSLDEFVGDILSEAYSNTIDITLNPELLNEAKLSEAGTTDSVKQREQLNKFLELSEFGRRIGNVKKIINTDSKFLPKTMIESFTKQDEINSLIGEIGIQNADVLLGKYDVKNTEGRLVKPSTISGYASFYGVINNNDIFSRFFPYEGRFYQSILARLQGISGNTLNADVRNNVFKEMKNYKYSSAIQNIIEGTPFEERKRLTSGEDALPKRITDAKNKSDNIFLSLLDVRQDKTNEPFRLIYNNAEEIALDRTIIQKSFNEFLLDPETTELAEDIIKYALLTNVNNSPSSFLSLVPIEYYETTGILENLRNVNWDNTTDVDVFIDQLIRNNPKYARKVTRDDIGVVEEEDGKILSYENFNPDNYYYRDGERYVIPYNSFYNEDISDYQVFKFDRRSGTYKNVDKLGWKELKEYDAIMTKNAKSAFGINNASVNIIDDQKQSDIGERTISDENQSRQPFLASYDTSTFNSMLKSIKDRVNKDATKQLIDLMVSSGVKQPDVIIDRIGQEGLYNKLDNVITIDNRIPEDVFIRVFLHESLHAVTSQIINSPLKSEAQRDLVRNLEGIRRNLEVNFRQNESEKYNEFLKKYNLLQNDIDAYLENPFTLEERGRYYGTVSVDELISQAFTDDVFQEVLNNTKFTGDKTIIDRLIEVITKFLNSFTTIRTNKINDGSNLEATVRDTVLLIGEGLLTDQQQEIENNQDLSDLLSPIAQIEVESLEYEYELRNTDGSRKRYPLSKYKERLKATADINVRLQQTPYSARLIKIAGEKGDSRVYYATKIIKNDQYLFSPTTDADKKFLNFVKKLKEDIRDINRKLTSENEPRDVAILTGRKENLERQIAEAEDDLSLETFVKIGNEQIQEVKGILASDFHSSQELMDVLKTLTLWSKSVNILLDQDRMADDNYANSKIVKEVADVREQAQTLLEDNWLPKSREHFKNVSKKVGINKSVRDIFNITTVRGESIGAETDINTQRRRFLDLSRTGSPLLSIIDKLIRDSTVLGEQESITWFKDIDKRFNEFKKTDFFKKQRRSSPYEIFAQKFKDGKRTGNLISRFRQEYYDELKKLSSEITRLKDNNANPTSIKNAWQDFYNFKRKNEINIDIRQLYDEDLNFKGNKFYIQEVERELGKERTEQALERAQRKVDKYKEQLEAEIERIEVLDDERSDQELIDLWKAKNDPFRYLNNLDNKVTRETVAGESVFSKGYNFIEAIPKKEWHDPDFDEILKDEQASEFYDWYLETLRKMYRIAPDKIFEEFQPNFIPNIPLKLLEEINTRGLFNSVAGIGDRILDVFREKNFDAISFQDSDRVTGKAEYSIEFPIKPDDKVFITEGQKERAVEKQSMDLQQILKIVTSSVMAYKHKQTVEDDIKLGQALFDSQNEIVTKNNQPVIDQNDGEIRINREGLVNKKELLEYAVIKGFYATNPQTEFNPKLTEKTLSAEDKKVMAEIDEMIASLPEGDSRIEYYEDLKNRLGAPITSRKVGRSFLNYVQAKGMGWNVFSGFTNLLNAFYSNYIHSVGNEDFSQKDLMFGLKKMMNSAMNVVPEAATLGLLGTIISPGFGSVIGLGLGAAVAGQRNITKESKKINNLMKKFDVLGDLIDSNNFEKDFYTGERKTWQRLMPYELQRKSEYFSQGITLVAMLNSEKNKLTTKDGKKITLYEAFDENGNFREDLFTEEVNEIWKADRFDLEKSRGLLNFKANIDQVIKSIHGNYDKKSPVQIKKTLGGQALLQFRSWIAEGVANRFEGEFYDENLGRYRVGRWWLVKNKNLWMKLLKKAVLIDRGVLTGYEAHEIAAFNRSVAETRMLVGMMLMVAGLKYAIDDDEEERHITNFAVNQMLRLQNDMMFFMSPGSVENLSRSAVPALSIVSDISKILDYSWRVLFTDNFDEKTEDALITRTIRLVPGGSASINAIKAQEKLFNK